MSIPAFPQKDPDSNLRYYWNWEPWVTVEDGGEIVSYAVAIDNPPDAALLIGDTAIDGSVVMAWISGGTVEQTYTVRCRVTLQDGTIEDSSRTITIAPK